MDEVVAVLVEIRDEIRRVADALEAGGPPECDPDGIACPHCGNSDPDLLEACPTTDAPDRWFCKSTTCAKSFREVASG